MRRLIIKNLGPINSLDIDLKRINVFIGPQSSGKSTIAKVISFCTWLDKHREGNGTLLFGAYKKLQSYHRLKEYFNEDTAIFYEGDNVVYCYNPNRIGNLPLSDDLLSKTLRVGTDEMIIDKEQLPFNPKVIYIPSERNFVSSVPNLLNYAEDKDFLQGFIQSWYDAKRHYSKTEALDVLNLGVKYYSEDGVTDSVELRDGKTITLSSSSSGLQSVIPLLVMIEWLSKGIYEAEKPYSPLELKKFDAMLSDIKAVDSKEFDVLRRRLEDLISGKIYSHTQFIIEEPCQNLFPKAQKELVYKLISDIGKGKNHRLVLTTHSPYVLTSLNNLIYAGKVGLKHKRAVEKLIPSTSWIDYKDIDVFYVSNGGVRSIMDVEICQIRAEEIDGISNILNEEFDKLVEIEG